MAAASSKTTAVIFIGQIDYHPYSSKVDVLFYLIVISILQIIFDKKCESLLYLQQSKFVSNLCLVCLVSFFFSF